MTRDNTDKREDAFKEIERCRIHASLLASEIGKTTSTCRDHLEKCGVNGGEMDDESLGIGRTIAKKKNF
jgi:hypothetical protein